MQVNTPSQGRKAKRVPAILIKYLRLRLLSFLILLFHSTVQSAQSKSENAFPSGRLEGSSSWYRHLGIASYSQFAARTVARCLDDRNPQL